MDIKNNLDRTPLHLAAAQGCFDAVELLVQNQAPVDPPDKVSSMRFELKTQEQNYQICKMYCLGTLTIDLALLFMKFQFVISKTDI